MLGGALLGSGLLGGNDEDEEKQGFMSGLTNISNSMFAGMSQEQVYRLGQGFNTMRLEPDQAMHESFENRISDIRATDAASANKNATVEALLGMTSDKYPNGRVDLAAMVKQGVLPPAEAISMAIKVEPMSAFAEKMQWLKDNPNASDEQKALAGITVPIQTEFDKKFELFTDDSPDSILTAQQREIGLDQLLGTAVTREAFEKKIDMYNELKAKGPISPKMLELLGIPSERQSDFEKKMDELELLAQESGMKPNELMNRKIDLISNYTADDGMTDAIKTMNYRAKQAGLIPGTDEYKAFFRDYGGGDTNVNVDLSQADISDAEYDKKLQAALVVEDMKDIKAVRKAEANIRKLDQVLQIITEGDPNLGALSGFYQTVDEVMAKFGLSEESANSATDTQLLEALLGSDVFGMIAILGIGARGIDTPAERDFLIKVMTGERKMTPEALHRMTLYRRKYSRMVIEAYNKALKDGYYDDYQRSRKLKHIDVKPLEAWKPPEVENILSVERANELADKYNLK